MGADVIARTAPAPPRARARATCAQRMKRRGGPTVSIPTVCTEPPLSTPPRGKAQENIQARPHTVSASPYPPAHRVSAEASCICGRSVLAGSPTRPKPHFWTCVDSQHIFLAAQPGAKRGSSVKTLCRCECAFGVGKRADQVPRRTHSGCAGEDERAKDAPRPAGVRVVERKKNLD